MDALDDGLIFDEDLGLYVVDAIEVACDAWERGWTVDPPLTVSEWADGDDKAGRVGRVIAKGAGAEPGPWRTSRTPYLREIQDCLSDHSPIRRVDFKKSAQIGATEVGINWVGYVIERGLDSMIVAQPVKDLARSWAVSKFDPATESMPGLSEKITSNNTFEKRFPGGTLWALWANSAKQLRQRTARFIYMDEVDEYPDDVGGQGPADQQLEARAMSYGERGKVYRACTPTIAGASKIDAGYLEGDQRGYKVPCPHCRQHQFLEVERLQPNGTFACQHCGVAIEEHDKEEMLRERSADHPGGAYWEPRNPKAPAWWRSYHIWAAYSPIGLGPSWLEIARRRAEAENDPKKLQAFRNLICGEVFEGERQSQDENEVAGLAEPGVCAGVVPKGGLILTAGIDLQFDRAEIQVVAWGRGMRGRVVEYAVIPMDPTRLEDYTELDDYLKTQWKSAGGADMVITAAAIDGGNWTETVAQWVRSRVSTSGQARMVNCGGGLRKQSLYLVRGRAEFKSERAVYRPRKSEVNEKQKTIARQVGVWGVGGSVIKHLIHGWLASALGAKRKAEELGEAEDLEARQLRFPGGRGEVFDPLRPDPGALSPAYYRGLTAEYFDLDAQKWICPKGARNEPLDTIVYAVWAALCPAVRIDLMRESQWAALESLYNPPTDLFSQPGATPPPAPKPATPAPAQPAPAPIGKDDWSSRL